MLYYGTALGKYTPSGRDGYHCCRDGGKRNRETCKGRVAGGGKRV